MKSVTSLLLFVTLQVQTSFAHDETLLPSEVTILINRAMQDQPDAARTVLTKPIVARLNSDNLSDIETFMLGEVYFLNLEPEPSRDGFWEARKRDDDVGRVASQRLMIIRVNAFQMADKVVDEDAPSYRKRFPVSPHDRYGISYPLSQAARLLAKDGAQQLALDLIVEEVKLHEKFDAPYAAYGLPGQFMKLAFENGRGDEFAALHDWVMEGLNTVIEKRLQSAPDTLERNSGIPGVVFRSLFEDESLSYHEWTAEFFRLRDRLNQRPD